MHGSDERNGGAMADLRLTLGLAGMSLIAALVAMMPPSATVATQAAAAMTVVRAA